MTFHRFQANKLIRDNLPTLLKAKGIEVYTEPLTEEESLEALKLKLLEEAQEVITASSLKEIEEELADVIEVLQALLKAYGLSAESLEKTRQEKHRQKGGFEQKVFCTFIDIEASNPSLTYYQSRPDQYPEIPFSQKVG